MTDPKRILFVSGQVPADEAGWVPGRFEAQCRLVWANIARRLADAGMALTDIAKVNIFLSSCDDRSANTAIRTKS